MLNRFSEREKKLELLEGQILNVKTGINKPDFVRSELERGNGRNYSK